MFLLTLDLSNRTWLTGVSGDLGVVVRLFLLLISLYPVN